MIDSETEYLMMRARQEAALAARASHPAAAAAHRHLSLRYSARALIELDTPEQHEFEQTTSASHPMIMAIPSP